MFQVNLVRIIAVGAVFSLLFQSCSGSRPSYRETPDSAKWSVQSSTLKGREKKDYEEIHRLYSKKSYQRALRKLSDFEKKYPGSSQISQVHNLQGLIYLYRRRPLHSVNQFSKAIRKNKNSDIDPFLKYNLASAHFEAKQYPEAQNLLKQLDAGNLDQDTRLKFHFLQSRLQFRANDFFESAKSVLIGAYLLNQSDRLQEQYRGQLKTTLKKLSSSTSGSSGGVTTEITSVNIDDQLERLFKDHSDSPLADVLLFQMGTRSLNSGKPGRADFYFRSLISRFPATPHYADAVHHLRSIQTEMVVDSRTVGVLLPMSGKYQKFGKQSLRGIELAFRIYNTNEPDSKVTLIIEDAGSTPEQAIKALEKLYFDHHVVAVIGPLLSKGIETVTSRADELGIPLISLSQARGVQSDYTFETAITPSNQASSIAKHAMTKLGLKKFAIVYPDDKYGREASEQFWTSIEELGGEIVGVEKYTTNETDFKLVVDRLTGLFYKDARQREIDALKALREKDGITRLTRKTEHYYSLVPVVDFEAVFIPDSAKNVSQILPTFAYRDVDGVQFLGTSTWNSKILLKRAKKYVDGSLFVGSFYPQSNTSATRGFISKYFGTFGFPPSEIEALSFDAASVLERTLVLSDSSVNRSEIKERLHKVAGHPGVTGNISYEEGRFVRNLKVLTIKNKQITEVF